VRIDDAARERARPPASTTGCADAQPVRQLPAPITSVSRKTRASRIHHALQPRPDGWRLRPDVGFASESHCMLVPTGVYRTPVRYIAGNVVRQHHISVTPLPTCITQKEDMADEAMPSSPLLVLAALEPDLLRSRATLHAATDMPRLARMRRPSEGHRSSGRTASRIAVAAAIADLARPRWLGSTSRPPASRRSRAARGGSKTRATPAAAPDRRRQRHQLFARVYDNTPSTNT
jgi:hypothetical protein